MQERRMRRGDIGLRDYTEGKSRDKMILNKKVAKNPLVMDSEK